MDQRSFGRHIKLARKEKGMTAEQLAEHLGISSKSVWQIEGGKTSTTLANLVNICNALDITPEYLLSKDLDPNIQSKESEYCRLFDSIFKLTHSELLLVEDMVNLLISNRTKYR